MCEGVGRCTISAPVGTALGLQHSWRRSSVVGCAGWVGCAVGQRVRMVDKEHTVPHSKLVLEEGWQGGLGAAPHGWQGGESRW